MRSDTGALGAAAGAIGVGLFGVAALVTGTPPDFDAAAPVVVSYFAEEQTRIQIGSAIAAAAMPFLVWFFATVASLARSHGAGAERAATLAFGCGLVFIALYLADVAALCVGALRPEALASAPELALAFHDFSWMAPAIAAFFGVGILGAYSALALRHRALWPRWLGWWAALAALAYGLRIGALFTTDGAFAADGVLGLWVPVLAITTWTAVASLVLARRLRGDGSPAELPA